MNNNYHAFRVDPFETSRVWFQTRAVATHTGELMGKAPTGKRLELPPQAFSMTFNEQGQASGAVPSSVTARQRSLGSTLPPTLHLDR